LSRCSATSARGVTASTWPGGLAPRYIVGSLPEGARPHVGTTDVDLVIGLTVDDESDEAYRTLENNLRKSGFKPESSFRWSKQVDGVTILVEFMCETDQVEPGRIFKPKQGLGTKFGAFNVRGAQLIAEDFTGAWLPTPITTWGRTFGSWRVMTAAST